MLKRRTAPVTTSAPDTSIAFRVSAKSLYLPVPTQSLDLNSRPAITNRSSYIGLSLPCSILVQSAAADERQDLHPVSLPQTPELKVFTVEYFQIPLHRD